MPGLWISLWAYLESMIAYPRLRISFADFAFPTWSHYVQNVLVVREYCQF